MAQTSLNNSPFEALTRSHNNQHITVNNPAYQSLSSSKSYLDDSAQENSLRKKSYEALMESNYSDKLQNSEKTLYYTGHKNTRLMANPEVRRHLNKASNHSYCANVNCNNLKKVRRKFQNKNFYYCYECAQIIDNHEYCHICYEISSGEAKDWLACDSCNYWVHI